MHAHHTLIVRAAGSKAVKKAVNDALEPFGDGDVWDWFEIGGRWKGVVIDKDADLPVQVAHELMGEGQVLPDIISWEKYPKTCRWMCQQAMESQQASVEYEKQGLKDWLEKAGYQNVYDVPAPGQRKPKSKEEERQGFGGDMVGHCMHKLGQLLAGYYSFNSHLYDAVNRTPVVLEEAMDEFDKSPEDIWVVSADLHN